MYLKDLFVSGVLETNDNQPRLTTYCCLILTFFQIFYTYTYTILLFYLKML